MTELQTSRPAHTYSIVAVDQEHGEIGIAVQSHWFSVGSSVAWIEPGVGAVATQSFINPAFGPEGLELLKTGYAPVETIKKLIKSDEGHEMRQVALIDRDGAAAAYTGKKCIRAAGHLVGNNYSVQANLMETDKVWPGMAETFENGTGPLAERMLLSMEKAESCGADIRGRQSAALIIVKQNPIGRIWEDKYIDLRVEDHPEPLHELRRLLATFRAYEHMELGEKALEKNNTELAGEEYRKAQKICPDNLEMRFWYAVSLINSRQISLAQTEFREIFHIDKNWCTMLERIYEIGILKVDKDVLSRLLSQANN